MKKNHPEGFCKKQDLQSFSSNYCTIKKNFTTAVCCMLGMFILSFNLCAQKIDLLPKNSFELRRDDPAWGNKLNDKSVNEIAPSYISSAIIKNFNKTFKNVNDTKWYVVDNFYRIG